MALSREIGRVQNAGHCIPRRIPADNAVMPLNAIRLVLVHPTHAGNIGAAARAMKTMGLGALYLVAPSADPAAPEARARAVGAEDLLACARVCDDLDQALADCRLVIGTSARAREIRWPVLTPRASARRLVRNARHGPVALLFGQERMGLTNSELETCRYVVTIPTDPAFPSLNIAAAVQIMAYELYLAHRHPWVWFEGLRGAERDVLATHAQRLGFYRHLEEVLHQIDFFGSRHPHKLMRRLVRLFNRAQPDPQEINILRGILTAVQRERQGDS
jgi:TrmH family RNA methyltransferase